MAFVEFSAICTSCMYSSRLLWGFPAAAISHQCNADTLPNYWTAKWVNLPSRIADLTCLSARPMLRRESSIMGSIRPGTAIAIVSTIFNASPL